VLCRSCQVKTIFRGQPDAIRLRRHGGQTYGLKGWRRMANYGVATCRPLTAGPSCVWQDTRDSHIERGIFDLGRYATFNVTKNRKSIFQRLNS
jgi:hypothetical protein